MRVTLNQLSKHFGPVKAVDNLNLEIGEGEFMALLGPSGCGKTTTLLIIAGFYKPTAGESAVQRASGERTTSQEA